MSNKYNHHVYTAFRQDYFNALKKLTGHTCEYSPFLEQSCRQAFEIPGAEPDVSHVPHDTLAHAGTGFGFPGSNFFELPAAVQELPYMLKVLDRRLTNFQLYKLANWTNDVITRTSDRPVVLHNIPKPTWLKMASQMQHRVDKVFKANPEFSQALSSFQYKHTNTWVHFNKALSRILNKPDRPGKKQTHEMERFYGDRIRRPILYDWVGRHLHLLKTLPPELEFASRADEVQALEGMMHPWRPKQDHDYINWRKNRLQYPNTCSLVLPKHRR